MYTDTYLSIVAAGLVPLLIGYVWYHPRLFGDPWLRMTRLTPEAVEAAQRTRPFASLIALIAGIASASVLYLVCVAWEPSDVSGMMALAAMLTIGFALPATLGDVLWERKPVRLYLIDISCWLVSSACMALILSPSVL